MHKTMTKERIIDSAWNGKGNVLDDIGYCINIALDSSTHMNA